MANIQNLRMGPCSINYLGVDMGHTLGGVKVTITRKLTDLKVDKYGDTPVDKVLTDVQMKISTKVAEPVVGVLKNAMPEGTYSVGPAGTQLGIGAGEGESMRNMVVSGVQEPDAAGLLILHPLSKPLTDTSEDVAMYLAVPTASPVVNYEVASQRVFDLEFEALVSEAYAPGRRLGHFGPLNIS
jgi:hypothetical protein